MKNRMNQNRWKVALFLCSSLVMAAGTMATTVTAEDGNDREIVGAAKELAKMVAGDDKSMYLHVLTRLLETLDSEKRLDDLRGIEAQIAKLQTKRQAILVQPGSTLLGKPKIESMRSILTQDKDFAPRVRSVESRTGLSRSALSTPSFFEEEIWQKNAEKMIDRYGLGVRPRIFNPDDNELHPTEDLLDCVSIGRPGSSCCTGTLIQSNVVLTAAHCIPCSATHAYVGSNSNLPATGSLFEIERIISHENYNDTTMHNDIAVVVLRDPIPSSLVAPRALASTSQVTAASSFIAVGFGYTDQGNFGLKFEAPVALIELYAKEFRAGGSGLTRAKATAADRFTLTRLPRILAFVLLASLRGVVRVARAESMSESTPTPTGSKTNSILSRQ